MKVLVTGAAGYIGSIVCERLLAAGHVPIALDNLTYGVREAVPAGVTLDEASLTNPDEMNWIFQDHPGIEAVVHLAAESAIPLSMTDPGIFYHVNVQGGLNLLDAMREYGVKKFVFSSTSSVYAPIYNRPMDEHALPSPSSPYGASKLAFEGLLEWYAQVHGFQHVIFRYFNVNGATPTRGEFPYHRTRLIPQALGVAQGLQEALELYGRDYPTPDGTCVRDYLHVQDVADAHILALDKIEQLPEAARVFNLGIGKSFSNLEVIQACRDVSGHPIPIIDRPRRPGDPPQLTCNPGRANRVLGWQPQYTDLRPIVETAWKWQQEHP